MNKINKSTGIDALFGSKTRVKLLHLFLNNPDKAFYVREITRLIDEQINSVRRELANMVSVGVITSDSSENKLYYQVNEQYQNFNAFRAIFSSDYTVSLQHGKKRKSKGDVSVVDILQNVTALRVAIVGGSLVRGSAAKIDLILVGKISSHSQKNIINQIESKVGRELTYTFMDYDEFYYRLSVKDTFIADIMNTEHIIAVDTDNILKG